MPEVNYFINFNLAATVNVKLTDKLFELVQIHVYPNRTQAVAQFFDGQPSTVIVVERIKGMLRRVKLDTKLPPDPAVQEGFDPILTSRTVEALSTKLFEVRLQENALGGFCRSNWSLQVGLGECTS